MSRLGDEFRRLLAGRMLAGKLKTGPVQEVIHPVRRVNVVAAQILDEDLAAREIRVLVTGVDYELMTVSLEFQLLTLDGEVISRMGDATVQKDCSVTIGRMNHCLWIDIT